MSDDPSARTRRTALGRAIEVQRVHLGMKRKDLAEAAELSYPYISELENGGKEPSAKALRRIADALSMTVAELIASGEQYAEPVRQHDFVSADHQQFAVMEAKSRVSDQSSLTPASHSTTPGPWSPPPAIADDALVALVRSVVREEFERFVAEALPDLVARELQRALVNAVRPPAER